MKDNLLEAVGQKAEADCEEDVGERCEDEDDLGLSGDEGAACKSEANEVAETKPQLPIKQVRILSTGRRELCTVEQ